MTPERLELLHAIESFNIDGGIADLPFAARLAREHGWSRPFAERVIREYKRYVFLAMGSESPVCPSEEVDAAWHLHLTYTRSYWKRFCGETLGRALHHDPTRGGAAESAKHLAMYEATLDAYRHTFGEEPPADIWPPASQRFGDDIRQRMVNTARNWVIPKRPVKCVLQVAAGFVIAAVILPGCNGGLNPFNLQGTDFLLVLIPLMIAAICLGRILRSSFMGPGPLPEEADEKLSWEDLAYLAGGYARLTTAAIARLAEAKMIRVADDRLEAGKVVPQDRSPIEDVIIGRLPIAKTDLKAVQDAVEVKFGNRAAKLEEEGYSVAKPRQVMAVAAALMPLAAVELFLALPRLLLGLSKGKPAGFLVATIIIGGIIGFIACVAGNRSRSHRADAALNRLRKRNVTSKTDAGLAVALFGTAILAGSTVAYLQDWYPRTAATGADGGCGTSSDSGGSDGGSGCGGGGGCGGCGGGD